MDTTPRLKKTLDVLEKLLISFHYIQNTLESNADKAVKDSVVCSEDALKRSLVSIKKTKHEFK